MTQHTYEIDLATLNDFTEVSQQFKDLNIINYVYYFVENRRGIIKFGYSADNSAHYGDRVYRQAGHLHGWRRRLEGSSGSDMRIICEQYQEKYNEVLDRKNMKLYVINMNRKSVQECQDLERKLIDDCVLHNDRAPLGNRDSTTRLVERRTRNQKILSKFFDTESESV
jgi:hypothetical protein